MGKNERWLLCALLGCNDDRKLFRDKLNHEVWRGRDYLYLFMTEKDIQAKLTAELSKYNWCHVHVEVPVYGKTNKRVGTRSESYNFRPDIFLLSTRRKEKRKNVKERHLELTAVEIKYFGRGNSTRMKKMIKKMIKRDMDKLCECITARVQPKADNGFFLCIDESGLASTILADYMAQRRMKGKKISSFVLEPNYVTERRDYPMNLEQYQQGLERSSVYVMDRALGKLKRKFGGSFEFVKVNYYRAKKNEKTSGPWFWLHIGKKSIGWTYLDWKFRKRNRIRPALVIKLYDESAHDGDAKPVEWSETLKAYWYSDNQAKPARIYHNTSVSYRYDLMKMNKLADVIYSKLKKLL
jgi:hypothetical protein